MGAVSPSVTGERLINFDIKVVAQNGANPISYNQATNTCTLVCDGEAHDSTGVTLLPQCGRLRGKALRP